MEPLNGHQAGNGGHSQGASCTPPHRSPTRLHMFGGPLRRVSYWPSPHSRLVSRSMRYVAIITLCVTVSACQGSSSKENPDVRPDAPASDVAGPSDSGVPGDVLVALPLDSPSMDGGTVIDAIVLAVDANPGFDEAVAVDLVTIPDTRDAADDVPAPKLDTAPDTTTADLGADGGSDNCSSSPDGGGGCALASVLVIAPHPDDDIITSSGVIVRAPLPAGAPTRPGSTSSSTSTAPPSPYAATNTPAVTQR